MIGGAIFVFDGSPFRKEKTMLKSSRVLAVAVILLVVAAACSPQVTAVPTLDPNFINTVIAATVSAGTTQTAQAFILQASPTPTLEPPTPTASLSPTPEFTPTPSVPLITVSVATNCRVGPGRAYDRIGALLIGETAEVFGRDPTGNYWYIRNPDRANDFCWLWGEYATLVGNTAVLPVYTPPPTPTPIPDFTAVYANLETCVGWWVDLRLDNTGGMTFRSVSVTLRDTVTNTVISLTTDGFTNNDGCTGSSTRDILEPGGRRVVSAPAFNYDPTGNDLRATITLCTDKGLKGVCVSKVINFKP
jgi:hypothetical protein